MRRTLQLAAIGTAAGAFSGLFGVGGGTIIVPLLIVWLAYGEREATGTSMAAIIVIAAFAVAFQAGLRERGRGNAALVGIPAIGGRRRRHGSAAAAARARHLAAVRRAADRDRGGADRPVSEVG